MARIHFAFAVVISLGCACGDDGDDYATPSRCRASIPECDIEDEACARSVLELTACVREDDTPRLPEIRLQTAAEAVERLKADIDAEELEPSAWDGVLRELALLPEGESSADASVSQFVDSVAAFYHTRDKDVTIITESDSGDEPQERMYVLSHEFVHYLQDRESDLEALSDAADGSTDQGVALDALVEGEAVVTSTRVLIRLLGRSPDQFSWERFFASMNESLFENVQRSPAPLIAALQLMPYGVGGDYVAEIWDRYGREAVDDLFEEAPATLQDWLVNERSERPAETFSQPLDCAPPRAPAGFQLYELDRFGAAGVFALTAALDEADIDLASSAVNDAIALYVTEDAEKPAEAPALAVWRMRFENTGSANEMVSLLSSAGFGEDARRKGTEVWLRVSTDPNVTALRGDALDACPKLEELEPQRTTPDMPSGALGRFLPHRTLSRALPTLR